MFLGFLQFIYLHSSFQNHFPIVFVDMIFSRLFIWFKSNVIKNSNRITQYLHYLTELEDIDIVFVQALNMFFFAYLNMHFLQN